MSVSPARRPAPGAGSQDGAPVHRRLRLLLVSDSYPPLIGGATRASQLLAQDLARRGHEVCVATSEQPGAAPR
jgi:hypothetical protein